MRPQVIASEAKQSRIQIASGLLLLAMTLGLSAGCVKRTLLIDSVPPGAKVWINEHPAGTTPVKYEFITHGRYKFRLQKSGFREVVAREMIWAPVYEWIPLDFFFENVIPIRLEEKHPFRYVLTAESPSEWLKADGAEQVKADLKDLGNPDPKARRTACIDLARARDPSTADPLLAATRDPIPAVRKAAAQALRAVSGRKSLPRLVEMLGRDTAAEVRWQAAAEMEALKDKEAVPPLIKALKDRDPLVRAGAAEALKGIPDPRAAVSLIAVLREKDSTARRAAAEALGKIGDRAAVHPLVRALRHHDFRTRRWAAKSLGQLGDPASSVALARALDDWDPKTRRFASQALIQMKDTRPVPLLIRYLRSWKPATREEAAIALGGFQDQRALEPLVRAFRREPNERTSHALLEAIRSFGVKIDESWERLDLYRFRLGEKRKAQRLEQQEGMKKPEQEEKKKKK